MSTVGNGATLAKFLALVEDGTAHKELRAARSRSDWARRLGISESSLRSTIERARKAGLEVPDWGDAGSGEDVTQAETPRAIAAQAEIDVPHRSPQAITDDCLGLDIEANGSYLSGCVDDFKTEEPTKNEGTRKPDSFVVPENFDVRAKSTLVRADGSVVLEWIKTSANRNVDPVEVLRSAFEVMPKSTPVEAPAVSDDDLLVVIAYGDPHFGQLSWHRDAGENFDLDIAERNMIAATAHLVAIAPPATQCLLIWIGDNVHSDGQSNTTTKGTRVDVDGRTIKMLAVAIRAFRASIELALAKFGKVHGIIERGNHDELLSAVIALALSQFYENDTRVTIDTSPEMYHWYRFGQNLIGTHHGDKAKPMDLLGVMANDRAKDWGETTHRRFYCGHIHHEVVKEVPGLVVEYLRTLAPGDAWHRGQGYRAGRDLRLDVIHREFGIINRHIVGIEQIRKAG